MASTPTSAPAPPDRASSGADEPRYQAVSLDVGGVLVVPDHGMLGVALDRAGIAHDRARFGEGHYRAMAAVDQAASDPEDFTDYLWGFVAAVGVAEGDQARAHDALAAVLGTPVWCQPVPGSRAGVAALAAAGLRLAVTSNSDGTVADLLARHEWVQVGPGPGVEADVITDSGIVGAGKPDPRMFRATVDGLGLAPEQILHVGDSVHYDVDGAAAVGMGSVHMDPHGLCRSDGHPHVSNVAELLDLVGVTR
jgi:FMN phosphatase YigB (HAD superfamily)